MADSGVKEAEASMANLLLDEVTGEKVSKTELKRRQKLREKEAKKKEKEAAAPPKAEKKISEEEAESNLSPNVRLELPRIVIVSSCAQKGSRVWTMIAILRDSKPEDQQAPRDQEPRPLPAQVPGHRRPATVPQGLRGPRQG